MKYAPPIGSADPDANYTNPVDGTIPAAAIEQPMREITSVLASMGIVPSETDLTQLDQAIDMKVAAVQPDLTEFVSRNELSEKLEKLTRYMENFLASEKYDLCEFYYFRNPTLKPGFMPAEGELLENALSRYPQAGDYLQSCEGQKLCVTEEEWQAMHHATWATLADGTKVGWNGIGGVPFFVLNTAAGSLRLPDLRGMYAEAAGFDGLETGGVHGDGSRRVSGYLPGYLTTSPGSPQAVASSALYWAKAGSRAIALGTTYDAWDMLSIDSGRTQPVANKNQPRAWGALACVYLGRPAS